MQSLSFQNEVLSLIYAVTIMLPKLIEVPRKAIKQLSMPILSEEINNKNWEKIGFIYKALSLNQLTASIFAALILFVNMDHILNLIPHFEMKETAKTIIFFLAITKVSDSSMSIGNDLMMMSKHFWFSTLSAILLIIFTVIFNLIFIPIWKIKGAALATFLSFLIYNLSVCLFVRVKMKVHPFSFKMIHIVGVGILSYLASFFFPIIKMTL